MKVRKKPIIIEAKELFEDTVIVTAHGPVPATTGDYQLTDPSSGDTWPVRKEIFERTYEIVEGE